MPMSQHRPALAAILVAFVAALSLSASTLAAAGSPPPVTNPIAADALSYVGTYQGECWPFMKKVVAETTGHQIGFDYRQGFFDAGAVEVSPAQAQAGDIIQVANDANTAPNADYPGLHTAIVLRNLGNGLFDVVDSNENFDGMVHERDGYSPGANAAAHGLSYHIYRIGGTAGVGGPAPALQAVPPGSFATGDRAVTNTPGDVLNLRSGPGSNNPVIGRLADRTAVTLASAPVTQGGYHWVQVTTPQGSGWVAAEFLLKQQPTSTAASAPSSPSGSDKVAPVLRYRSVGPGVSADH